MLKRLLAVISAPFRRSSPFEQLISARVPGGFPNTAAKVTVTEQTALRYAAVYACIRCIAETKGSLPYEMFEVDKSGRETRVTQHDLIGLLTTEPNPDMTPMVWSETRQAFTLTGGNGYTEIVFDQDGIPRYLIPRHWSLVTPFRSNAGDLMYRVTSENGGAVRTLDRSQMLHVPAMGNGIVGWSPIRLQSEVIGIGLAKDRFAATYYGNSARPSLAVTTEGHLLDDEYKRMKSELENNFTGDNAHRPMLLEGGAKVNPLSIPFGDAMSIDLLEFSEEEVARAYRVPPHMIGLLRRATFSNIEAQDLSFEKHTMRPWLVRDEQELKRKLIPRSQWGRFTIRHNLDALLRADIKTRYDAYKTGILGGFLKPNEARAADGRPPEAGGDTLLKPEAVFGKSGGNPNKAPAPAPVPAPAPASKKKRSGAKTLQRLTAQTVRGWIQREITQAERMANRPTDFAREVKTQYEKHSIALAEKFAPFGERSQVMAAALDRHRTELLAIATSTVLSADVPALANTWLAEVDSLTQQLMGA
ncbi:MAG: phage portal protein [Planctomycetes bacterium]|nr:phage portal protein [Planctomycetota bacterium]